MSIQKFDPAGATVTMNNITLKYSDYPYLSKEDIYETAHNYVKFKQHGYDTKLRSKKMEQDPPQRYIYMVVTNDEYELPLAVGDSTKEVANILGMKVKTVREMYSHHYPGYLKLPITEEEYQEIFE